MDNLSRRGGRLELASAGLRQKDQRPLSERQVQFLFGATLPTVISAPLHETDIALPARRVSSRWGACGRRPLAARAGFSGPPDNQTTHVIVKPTAADLRTDLIIAPRIGGPIFGAPIPQGRLDAERGFSYRRRFRLSGTPTKETRRRRRRITRSGNRENLLTLDFKYQVMEGSMEAGARL